MRTDEKLGLYYWGRLGVHMTFSIYISESFIHLFSLLFSQFLRCFLYARTWDGWDSDTDKILSP